MAQWIPAVRRQLPVTLRLSFPMVLGQLGQMAMILIDTLMVGKLGAAALGGVGLGSAFFYIFTLFGAGTLFGLDYLVSHARGRGADNECHHWLWQGVYLSLFLSIPIVVLIHVFFPPVIVRYFPAELAPSAIAFLKALNWSLPPFLVFITFRQYLQAMGSARPGMVITLAAIGANLFFNWVLIFGNLGAPALGVAGAGFATTFTRSLMALAIIVYTLRRDAWLKAGLLQSPKRPKLESLVRLFRLGTPAGLQYALESSVFSIATALVSQLGVVAVASHTIALNLSGFTYMIPFGLSGATAVLVGREMGRRDGDAAILAGWTSIGTVTVVMSLCAMVFLSFAGPIVSQFTLDPQVIELTTRILLLVAVYQIADGLQAVGGGALRGLGETRSSMIANFCGYYLVGLPAGYWLGIHQGFGVMGFWAGLTIGLFSVSIFVLREWTRRTRKLEFA